MHFKALPVGHQNEQISSDFLHQISKELYRSGLKEQNEQISVKSADLNK